MSESSLTVESLRRHLPFLDEITSRISGSLYLKELKDLKNGIESGKRFSPKQVQKIERSIVNTRKKYIATIKKKIQDSKNKLSSGSGTKIMNIKNNQTDVICISSDDETVTSNLPYHKEHEVIEIKTKEQNVKKIPINQVKEIVIKPERPDVQIIMTTVQTNNITPDTDSQKMSVKSERCEVQTIIQEVNLNTDHNGNSQQQVNNNSIDDKSIRVKVEEPESDIEDYKTVYSGSSERSHINTIPEPEPTENDDDDDEILPPASAKRKRRKISSSSEVSDVERSKEKKKRRRIIQQTESSDDEKKSSKSSNSAEFYSAESIKSPDVPVENKSTNDEDEKISSLDSFRDAVKSISTDYNTTGTEEIANLIRQSISDEELPKILNFLKQCSEKRLLDIDLNGSSTSKKTILEDFISNTLSTSKQLRNRVVVPNEKVQTFSEESTAADSNNEVPHEKVQTSSEGRPERPSVDSNNEVPNVNDQTSSSDESSESSTPDFTDDQDYECYLSKKPSSQRKTRNPKKVRTRMRELDKLKEDIDKSFIKPALLTLKPRQHKMVDYGIDIKLTTSDDTDDFVNSIRKDKPESLRKKKYSKRRRISDSSSSRVDQDKINDSDQSGSEIGYRRSTRSKVLEELDSDRTTPDNLVRIDTVKNEACDDNRSTPDIDLENDPRVRSFEYKRNVHSDEDMDTDCSSGVTVQVNSENKLVPSSDDPEDENNPMYHFITLENITRCKVNISKLDIDPKPEPYKIYFENGVWKVDNRNTTPAVVPEFNNPEINNKSIEDTNTDNVQSISKDQPTLDTPEVLAKVENDNIEDSAPVITVKKPTEEEEDVQEPQTERPENLNNSLEDNLFYDPILSDSDGDFEMNEDTISEIEETEKQDLKPIDPLTSEITVDPHDIMIDIKMNSITEEKYKIQEEISLYDPISSDSEDDALHIDMETEEKGETEEVSNKNKEQNNLESIPNDKISNNQHPVTEDTISSNSEEDVLHIDMETEEKAKEVNNKNKEQNIKESIPNDKINNDQHPAAKDTQNKTTESNSEEWIIIEDSEEIARENNIQRESSPVKPTTAVIPENNQNSTLKEKLNRNSNTPAIAVKPSNTPKKNKDLQRTPKKTQQRKSLNIRKCSPMSKLLTENERKILNLSYIACRGGIQYRCLNSCTYYNLKEETFRYHILSRHGMDKWAGFCNLCGKSYSTNILSLFDEYQHMIDFHIKPEHEKRLNSKENVDKENDDNDSHDSDCILLSQPSGSNSSTLLPQPIAIEKNENEAATSVLLGQTPTDNIEQHDYTSSVLDLPKSPLQLELPSDEQDDTSETSITDNLTNGPVVPVNTETILENTAPKQILRFKCLPGDKLSGKNDGSSTSDIENPALKAYTDLNPEMTFGELTELELAKNGSSNADQPAVQESSSNQVSQPLSQIPEGCVPQTTPEQEATLLAVIEENISRYVKIAAQPPQPVNIGAGATLPTTVQPNSIILHTTSNVLVTYTPPTMLYNNMNQTSMAQSVMNQSYQVSCSNLQFPSRNILPNQSYQPRPTAAIASRPKSNYSDLESRIPKTVIVTNNAQNSNAYTMAPSANYMNTNQRAPMQVSVAANQMQVRTMQVPVTTHPILVPVTTNSMLVPVTTNSILVPVTINPINAMQNSVSSIQNQTPGTSRGVVSTNVSVLNAEICRTRNLRPWLNIDDLKTKSAVDICFTQKYLMQLYKCMFISCCFATDNVNVFRLHLQLHQQAVNNSDNLDFQCSYCVFKTKDMEKLILHITENYSRCNIHCSRCFYRTCSQYSALQHIKIHVNVESTKLYIDANIPSVLEDKEFKKIKLRKLPTLKCIKCPQIFYTYDQFRLHLKQCYDKPIITCNKCNKTDQISNLEGHLTKCYGIYIYNCCYCTFGTQNLDSLSNHVVHTHMNKIPFYVERCDTTHLLTNLTIKAACIKKFSTSKLSFKVNTPLKVVGSTSKKI